MSLNRKLLYITRLLRQRDELVSRIARIDKEIETAWHGKAASNQGRRGARQYTAKDEKRILALSKKGMSERKIAQVTGIPHATVGRMIEQNEPRKRS
jgi:DNA-binding NarL/FixJ family response regulator